MVIAFTGPYCDNNYGDYAMFVNDVLEICNIHKDITEILVFGYDFSCLDFVIKKYLANYPIKKIFVKSNIQISEKYSNKFKIEYSNECLTPTEIVETIDNYKEIEDVVSNIDILILSGGGCFNYYWLAEHRKSKMYCILASMIIAKQQNKKIITLGNTYGPWGSCNDFFCLLLTYLQIEDICVRDKMLSEKELLKLGISDNFHYVIDDLYFLNSELEYKELDSFNIKNYFVIELYCSMEEIEKNYNYIYDFVKTMKSDYSLIPVLLPFGDNYGGMKQSEYLKNRMGDDAYLYYRKENFLPIEDVEKIIKGAKFVLCDRYHALVRSVANKIPCIQYLRKVDNSRVYYYNKGIGFLKILLGENYSASLENLFFNNSLKDMFCDYDDILSKLNMQKIFYENCEFEDWNREKRLSVIESCIDN